VSDEQELGTYVDIWWGAVDDFTALLESLAPQEWQLPSRLAGWSVHDIAAHTAHLEHLLNGGSHDDVEVGSPDHVNGMMGTFTEQGVVARRDRTPDELINEIREATTARHTALLSDPPSDGNDPAPGLFGAIGWTQRTLLRNRPLDIWLHEQDVRAAVHQPGNLDSPAAVHTADYLAESFSYVLAKKVAAPPGTSVVLDVAGHSPVTARVTDEGKGVREAGAAADAAATLTMSRDTFVTLAGGRGSVAADAVRVSGDAALAASVLASMAVTP